MYIHSTKPSFLSPDNPNNRRRGDMGIVDGEVSSWKPVLSGVPQGSVLGPIFIFSYTSMIWRKGVTGNILKFADDTKLFRKTKEMGEKLKLQDDIDKLVMWSDKWQMLFNFGKCKCLHTGPGILERTMKWVELF